MEKLYKELLAQLQELATENGILVFDAANIGKINAILEKLKSSLFGGEYLKALSGFAIEIQKQAELSNKLLQAQGIKFKNNDTYEAMIKQAQHNTLLLFDENAVSTELLQPLNKILTSSLVNRVSQLQAGEALRDAMTGENALFQKYANTYAHDAFATADRQYANLVNNDFGLVFALYDGSRIRGTRYFCCVRKGNFFHRDEIASWGQDESLWENPHEGGTCEAAKGGGRKPDTNSSNIFDYLGGYGCIDILVWMAPQYVPLSDIARAKSLGYY